MQKRNFHLKNYDFRKNGLPFFGLIDICPRGSAYFADPKRCFIISCLSNANSEVFYPIPEGGGQFDRPPPVVFFT